ncbi:uncharacterized protein TM35_000044340 [Trypanosoma theileri]|uniref:Uncharacterized protein n=1 Tax=Trypanosoma theileri TaxID=67003 RepID=A0A1X0P713_9TRYP|nr:uncharacterized protein TM35_000044340 [Trypanosoma theileri]ORC92220.1 hypothetical protein TM35_000044340 [Trypanosoma theileri]
MILDNVFPVSSGVPSLGLQVGGAPLEEVLTAVVRLLRSQQQELEGLRRELGERISNNEVKLQKHDEDIKSLSDDLKLQARPIHFYNQPPIHTMAEAVTNMESRLARVEKKEKKDMAVHLGETNNKKLAILYYNQWLVFRKMRTSGKFLLVETKKNIWQRYMRKWNRFLAFQAKRRAQQRHLTRLLLMHENRLLMTYWYKWTEQIKTKEYHRVQRRMSAYDSADLVLRLTSRSIARRAFNDWMKFTESSMESRNSIKRALLLEQKTARLLAEGYLQKWFDAHRMRRIFLMRLKVLEVMRTKIYRDFTHSYLKRWFSFTEKRRHRRRIYSLIPYYHHGNLTALARRYFSRLYTFRLLRRETRGKEALEQRLKELGERADGIQRQLDLGLHTLSHTNSVLARVVDTVMIAEEPRSAIQRLLHEETSDFMSKVSLVNEVETRIPTVNTFNTPMGIREAEPSNEREWQTVKEQQQKEYSNAGEMLQKLRARLDKTYKTSTNSSNGSV